MSSYRIMVGMAQPMSRKFLLTIIIPIINLSQFNTFSPGAHLSSACSDPHAGGTIPVSFVLRHWSDVQP